MQGENDPLAAFWMPFTANKAFKSKEPEDADPRWLALLFCDANVPDFPRLAARRGETHAEAVILARNLANTPANSLTPEDMAEEARKLARRHDMNCEVLEREDIVSLGMGAFAAVNEVYARFFTSEPPARSFVEVSALPKNALVEIEVIAYKR